MCAEGRTQRTNRLKHPGKSAYWGWYDQYLKAADVNGGPIKI